MRSLSRQLPIGASRVETTFDGRRNGSETGCMRRPRRTSAPGSNERRSRRSRSSWRRASGYAVFSTWKPRSSRKPSRRSVRTRPPTRSARSKTRTATPARCRVRAHVRPARPPPTTITGGFGAGSRWGDGGSEGLLSGRMVLCAARVGPWRSAADGPRQLARQGAAQRLGTFVAAGLQDVAIWRVLQPLGHWATGSLGHWVTVSTADRSVMAPATLLAPRPSAAGLGWHPGTIRAAPVESLGRAMVAVRRGRRDDRGDAGVVRPGRAGAMPHGIELLALPRAANGLCALGAAASSRVAR